VKKVLFILAITILLFPLLGIRKSYAESATIGFSPATGSFGKEFVVSLLVDGHGDKFNAAQATVHASSSLAIKDLVLGDCHFSFLKTPGTQDPSFAGVILSTYSTKCTVYKLTLVPVAKGNASLSLAEVSVKRYGDAGNILSSTQNGSYTLTAALKAPAVPGDQAKEKSQEGLYAVYLNVLSEKNTPVSNATVILTPVEGKTRKQATTNRRYRR
jgi:hypothetical protein